MNWANYQYAEAPVVLSNNYTADKISWYRSKGSAL